jgi:hypothetical protein
MDLRTQILFAIADKLSSQYRLDITIILHDPKDGASRIFRSNIETGTSCPLVRFSTYPSL